MSAGVCTMPASTSWSTSLSPRPSMSSARRLAKCSSACLRCAGHTRPPVQRAIASSGRRTMAEPHSGQCVGHHELARVARPLLRHRRARPAGSRRRRGARRRCRRCAGRLRRISSSLCSVTLVTVVPPTNTGSRRATGVIAPVRPTCTSMASSSRRHLLRRELVRDRPARLARAEAQRRAAARGCRPCRRRRRSRTADRRAAPATSS